MILCRWKSTKRIEKLLSELETLKAVFDHLPKLPHIEENLRRESLLKSSVYSARIEGNPTSESQMKLEGTFGFKKDIHRLEISNLLAVYRKIEAGRLPKKPTVEVIKSLHRLTMKDLSPMAGQFRQEPWAIFNQAGVALYLAPPHLKVPALVENLAQIASQGKEAAPIKAALVQFLFEKIHPFADGNGRVGRLISSIILKNNGYGMRGLVSFEEYTDNHRSLYYEALEPNNNATLFIEFFLESLVVQANEVLIKIGNKTEESSEDSLLPRRQEILAIIRDHPHCSFDFISRRFPTINPKTLHYDLAQLIKSGFVRKLGVSRGTVYQA